MLLAALASGSMLTIVVTLVAALFIVFVLVPIHEYSHAWVAYKLGDTDIKLRGDLEFNPLKLIDPIGSIMLVLIGFGWGRSCPINPRNFENPKKDMALVAAAGPVSNLLIAWIFIFIEVGIFSLAPNAVGTVLGDILQIFLGNSAQISIFLAVLNLLPIPMFDGFTILSAFLKPETEYKIMANQRTISIVVIILLFTRILTIPIAFFSAFILNFFTYISELFFSLF
ncbi:MAG: site-2 protease family protein [Ruminococcaceae bacterium]|nr:site-2 protease family protein [Oscillospiraceae bacterium]